MSKAGDFSKKFRERYFKRKRIDLECEVITPMFLGNADGEAEWRAEPFKALLRFWWRVAHGQQTPYASNGYKELAKQEGALFGTAAEDADAASGRSLVTVGVEGLSESVKNPFDNNLRVPYPKKAMPQVNPLLYLGGMGLMQPNAKPKHSYFPPGASFRLSLTFPDHLAETTSRLIAFLQAFGAVGSRSRNGWGSFQISPGRPLPFISTNRASEILKEATIDWKKGFEKDYPNCLGKDGAPLLWKTAPVSRWEEAMRSLADAYIAVRAKEVAGIKWLDPNNGERHLLGIPLTHHNPTQPSRYASPLRFIVRKKNKQYLGLVLHLPQRFPENKSPLSAPDQKKVWETKIHKKLDKRLQRASYEECL